MGGLCNQRLTGKLRTSASMLLAPIFTLCFVLSTAGGCRRTYYRTRADTQSYRIVEQNTQDPRWSVPRIDITPDPRSRFYDMDDPDHPPLPPDDPAANQYMKCAYGMRGAGQWRDWEQNSSVENPVWKDDLPGAPKLKDRVQTPRIERLGLRESIEVGLINSRDYQEQIENMYLSALVLTFQRYRFDLRPLGFLGEPSTSLFFQNQPDDASSLELGASAGVSKLLPAGGQFVAQLANNTIWMFSGPNDTGTATSIGYSLVQPLLARAGRKIAMEDLTQSERNVLYSVRDFARFRKEFYVTTVTGERAIPLPGTTGGGELAFLISGQRTPTEGFYMLLFILQRWRNQEANVQRLEALIRDGQLLRQAGRISALDVTQLESSLASAQAKYVSLERRYYQGLDRFKLQLGLPPDLEVELDDTLLEPFQFVDRTLFDLERRLAALVLNTEEENRNETFQELEALLELVIPSLEVIEGDFETLHEMIPDRKLTPEESGTLVKEMELHRTRLNDLRTVATELDDSLTKARDLFADAPDLTPKQVLDSVDVMRNVRRRLLTIVRELTGLSIAARVEMVSLPPVPFGPGEAVALALDSRLDLMNRRGLVMDARRRLEIAANRLEGTVDILVEGELNTQPLFDGDNPTDFRTKDSNYRVGVGITTPLDRRRERNDYRAAQIGYQRTRRNFMAAEDQVKLDVRRELRRALAEQKKFESNRRALRVAARELDQAIEFGDLPEAAGGGQGLNISRALDNILMAQNELIEAWVDYETARLNLYRDMGVMEIDEQGHWVEPTELTNESESNLSDQEADLAEPTDERKLAPNGELE